jgi:hypothetical protein
VQEFLTILVAGLIAMWWAWSPYKFWLRTFIAFIPITPFLVYAEFLGLRLNYANEVAVNKIKLHVMTVLVVSLLPFALRRFRGWVIAKHSQLSATASHHRQFSIKDIIAWTLVTAVAFHSIDKLQLPVAQIMLFLVVLAFIFWLAIIPLVYLMLRDVLTEELLWLAAGHCAVVVLISPSSLAILTPNILDDAELLVLSGVISLIALTNLGLAQFLRLNGYRLFTFQNTEPFHPTAPASPELTLPADHSAANRE